MSVDGSLTVGSIYALQDLLKGDQESDSEDENQTEMAKMTPGDVNPVKKSDTTEQKQKKTERNKEDIWDLDDVPEGSQYADLDDPRPQPEYDIMYKQAVTAEDMFLQMGNKTPATSSCEDLVIKVKLPETKLKDIDLDITPKFIDLRTPKYKLGLHLPNPVDKDTGKAKWDSARCELHINLRNKRDYDFMNF